MNKWIEEKKKEYEILLYKKLRLRKIKSAIINYEYICDEKPYELYDMHAELEIEIEHEEEKLKLECINETFLNWVLICAENSEDRLKHALKIADEILDYINELYREACEYERMEV